MLNFNRSFLIRYKLEGGGYQEWYYAPDEHGDPLTYPNAYPNPNALTGDEEPLLIHHMSEEDRLNWREKPLFEETLAPLADFRHIVYNTEEESIGPPGLVTAPSSVASQASRASESMLEGQTPDRFPYCTFQYERKRELQNLLV